MNSVRSSLTHSHATSERWSEVLRPHPCALLFDASSSTRFSYDSLPPSAPQSLAVTVNGSGQPELTWTQGSPDTSGYRLYRATFAFTGTAGLTPRGAVSHFIDAPTVNGTYFYAVTARDAAGNESSLSNQVFQNFSQGSPVVGIFGATNGQATNQDVVLSFTATDGNQAPASVTALFDGQAFVSGTTVTTEGDHTATVTAVNIAGHTSAVTVSFAIDKTSPILAVSVQDGAVIAGSTAVFVAATDLHLATSSFILINDILGSTAVYRSGDVITRDGSYRLLMSALDLAGNTSSRTISFRVDAAPGSPLGLTVKLADTAQLAWTQPEPDVTAYRVYRDGVRVSASLYAGTAFEDVGYTAGAHVYEVSAVDGRGVEGPKARATVPAVSFTLAVPTLTRGFFDALNFQAVNASGQPLNVGPALAEVLVGNAVAASATAAMAIIPAGQMAALTAVVAVPTDLAASAAVRATLALPTDSGASVALVRTFAVSAADPSTPLVEAFPDALVRGANSPVRVRLYNRGTAAMDVMTSKIQGSTSVAVNDVSIRLKTTDGTLLASAGLNQTGNGASALMLNGRQVFFVTIPPGSSVLFDPIQIPVPNTAAASLDVVAVVSTPTFNLPSLNVRGVRGFESSASQATLTQVSYRVTAQSDRDFYDQGSSVTIMGMAQDSISGMAVPNAAVTAHVVLNGFDRRINAVTDETGRYRAGFFPLPNEAGVYTAYLKEGGKVIFDESRDFSRLLDRVLCIDRAVGFNRHDELIVVCDVSHTCFFHIVTNIAYRRIERVNRDRTQIQFIGFTLFRWDITASASNRNFHVERCFIVGQRGDLQIRIHDFHVGIRLDVFCFYGFLSLGL